MINLLKLEYFLEFCALYAWGCKVCVLQPLLTSSIKCPPCNISYGGYQTYKVHLHFCPDFYVFNTTFRIFYQLSTVFWIVGSYLQPIDSKSIKLEYQIHQSIVTKMVDRMRQFISNLQGFPKVPVQANIQKTTFNKNLKLILHILFVSPWGRQEGGDNIFKWKPLSCTSFEIFFLKKHFYTIPRSLGPSRYKMANSKIVANRWCL